MKSMAIAAILAMSAVPAAAQDYKWTGFYLGLHGGEMETEFGRPDDDALPDEKEAPHQPISGGFGGAQAGYNYQFPAGLVIGVEADVSLGDWTGDTHKDGSAITVDSRINMFATGRARAGWAFGRFLPFVTGGVIFQDADTSEHCPKGALYGHCSRTGEYDEKDTFTDIAFVYGGGLEIGITENLSIKGEWLKADFGADTHDLGPKSSDRIMSQEDFEFWRAGLNYRF